MVKVNEELVEKYWNRLGGSISNLSEFKKVAEFFYRQGYIEGSEAALSSGSELIIAKPQ